MSLLTDADVAETFGRSPEWVQDQCRAKRWPHVKVGKSYRFTPEQVAEIVRLSTVEPAAPTEADEVERSWDLAPGRRSA
jgi:hypothetical protein